MNKVALLIGVSEYGSGLNPLPGAAKDVEAMQRILQHPEMGCFTSVKQLINPERQAMEEAIETLFSGCQKDDLALLFFTGHGVKDESGKLYFATRTTRKNIQGELIKATAVAASFVQDVMSDSRSKRQVVILDCCFSGAFAEGWSAKDDGSVNLQAQLGGEGRAVLTSSTSTQYSFEQKELDLSTYTHYLVEGIETGAADLDNDGAISIDELHEYAKKKVKEAAPAMKPEIYAVKEGFRILLANAPRGDSKLRYRKEVENFAFRGEISHVGRSTLDELRNNLGLLPEDAAAIEAEVLKPYQEYKRKLQTYEEVFVKAIQNGYPLSSLARDELKHFQRVLGLREEDIAPIEKQHKPVRFKLSEVVSKKVSALRNPRAIAGTGTLAVVLLTTYFLVIPQLPVFTCRVFESPPTCTEKFYKLGLEKSKKRDFKGAIEDFERALGFNPIHAKTYHSRGRAYFNLGDHPRAIADYETAIKINPNDYETYQFLGNVSAKLSKYTQAIEYYKKAIQLDSREIKDAYVYDDLGEAYSKLGDKQGAIAAYQTAAELYQKKGYTQQYQAALDKIAKLQG
ncbi:caspase, EACC1-associated type [Microseira wollei]|uniref:Extracellular ligand-binding receptor n=1 Tax=Microseira wollei NIES-4236 TaxID=2530354 RepID=A0AAV3XA59_9CYAN|nr:tetratricopeptide repeat protein [Microseira wollei]GET38221.1 extracellular ligand-binding receptor [Microseira wollei NIES-4236]